MNGRAREQRAPSRQSGRATNVVSGPLCGREEARLRKGWKKRQSWDSQADSSEVRQSVRRDARLSQPHTAKGVRGWEADRKRQKKRGEESGWTEKQRGDFARIEEAKAKALRGDR